ncbi:MAG: TVP38/TMEM64 family protein [Thermodesulfobacteriota bacterium]
MHEGVDMRTDQKKSMVFAKAAILILFIAAGIYLVRFSPAKQYLTTEQLGLLVESVGLWAPLIFVFLYAIGVCLFLPATLLTTMGAAVFGPYRGFLYVWAGAMIGAGLAFLIGRYLGRDFAASLIGDRLKRFDDAIERNGFTTVLYLRLVYVPFTPMNFGMGLTKVRFWDYILGTALGIMVGTFIFTFFVGTIRDIWAGGRWEALLSWKIFLSLALFIFSFFIPKLLKTARMQKGLKAV